MKTIRKGLKTIYYTIKFLLLYPSNIFNHNKLNSTNRIAEDVSLKYCCIGNYNYIARRCSFYNVKTGNYCCFGPDVHIGGMQHSYWWYSMSPLLSDKCEQPKQTIIGNDVWIAAGCIIKQGITIGDGAVIGANSFVNKDVEPFSIVAGSPAKLIKYRFDENIQKAIADSEYWDYDPQKAKSVLMRMDADINI